MQPETGSLIGKKVSHYRVIEVIGGGGMGMVYKAEDLKLGRHVAVKFLPEELVSDTIALKRFEREARASSSLNHPNICTIYEVEEHEGQPFIVMELLEGETLRDRLASLAATQNKLALDQLLNMAIQICDGLQAAHAKSIIHRDIKPANIFLTSKGGVKILDFGVAKVVASAEAAETPVDLSFRAEPPAFVGGVEGSAVSFGFRTADPSTARPPVPQRMRDGEERGRSAQDDSIRVADATLTRTGAAMGTAGYMSPEQVRGEELDARTDIFSLGLVLYEMATGQRAFIGETAAVIQNAIVNDAPVATRELNSTLPAKLVTTIDKALEKDRERRYQSAAEMREDLEQAKDRSELAGAARPHHAWKWFATAACVVALAVTAGLYWRSHNVNRLKPGDTLIIAPFDNSTGNPLFDGALQAALYNNLEQSPYFNELNPSKIGNILQSMKHAPTERLTLDLARQVCIRTNSAAVIAGSIADAGNRYRVGLKAVNCKSGATTANIEAERKARMRSYGHWGWWVPRCDSDLENRRLRFRSSTGPLTKP